MVRLHSSGGVVSRTPAVRKQARMQRVREYFYGVRGDLSPHSQTVRLDDLRIYRIGGGPRAPTSALPIGADAFACLGHLQERARSLSRRDPVEKAIDAALWKQPLGSCVYRGTVSH